MKTTINMVILIVIYQKTLLESTSYNSLLTKLTGIENIKLVIWNNSPYIKISQGNFDYFEANNLSLSKIYNFIAHKYLKNDVFLMLSDDDSNYANYDFNLIFDTLNSKQNNIGLYIPQLYANKKLVSPAKRIYFKGRFIKNINFGITNSKNMLCMNSGMIITNECYLKMPFLFNEKLNFYGTDTEFLIRYEHYFSQIFVLPFKVMHDLSSTKKINASSKFRLNDSIHALKIICEKQSKIIKIFLKLYIAHLRIKYFLKIS